ncbi:MAG: hypothetical protein C0473_01040 [Cyanobacteria bacterium DS3.002]|jgi:hypothetical protein|nr:hypothetical protein [Cyanobacteria bacterium DS3.002]
MIPRVNIVSDSKNELDLNVVIAIFIASNVSKALPLSAIEISLNKKCGSNALIQFSKTKRGTNNGKVGKL